MTGVSCKPPAYRIPSSIDGSMGGRPKPTPCDFTHPDADPVLARSRSQRADWPEPHSAGWRTSRFGYVMGDAFRDDTPSNARVRIPAVNLEAGWCAWREIQFRSGGRPKGDHALVEEVVDWKDDRPRFVIHERDPTDVARPETLDALRIGHGLELAGSGTEAGHARLHHCRAGTPPESSHL